MSATLHISPEHYNELKKMAILISSYIETITAPGQFYDFPGFTHM